MNNPVDNTVKDTLVAVIHDRHGRRVEIDAYIVAPSGFTSERGRIPLWNPGEVQRSAPVTVTWISGAKQASPCGRDNVTV